MNLQMYSMHDAATGIFHKPIYQTTEKEALRTFSTTVNQPGSPMFNFPEHYDMYYLGEYDDNTGLMNCLPTPKFIAKAIQFRKEKEPIVQAVTQ